MRLEFHKQVASDISRTMDYYENVAGPLSETTFLPFPVSAQSPSPV